MDCKEIASEKQWTGFVERYSPEGLFQSWLWGEVLRAQRIPVWRLGFFEEKKLVAVAQAHGVAARRGHFVQVRHGPVLSEWNTSLTEQVVEVLQERFTDFHPLFLRVNPLVAPKYTDLLKTVGFRPAAIHAMDGELCWVLRLGRDEEMLASMRKSTRYEIRRAEKLGITITRSRDESDLVHFFQLYRDTAMRHGFVAHEGIAEEFKTFSAAGKAQLYLARFGERVVAATIILSCGNQAIYHHSASEKTTLPVTHLLQWQAIRDARDVGLTYYNFWGIAPEGVPGHPWQGITTFKTGFGGEKREYVHSHDKPLSALYVFPRVIERIRAWKRGYRGI